MQRLHPPQQRLHSHDHLTWAERLGYVVIRAEVESRQLVVFLGLGCKHENWYCALRTQATADLHAINTGQHHVENYQIRRRHGSEAESSCAIWRLDHRESSGLEIMRQHLTNAAFVIHNQYSAHRGFNVLCGISNRLTHMG